MAERDHAPLPCSSAARIVACHGSPWMGLQVEQPPPTDDTLNGEASHHALAQMLNGVEPNVGDIAPNGVRLTEEMLEGADVAADAIKARGPVGMVELTLPASLGLHPDNWGTPDHWVYVPALRRLYVDDYKYGHKYVDIFRNWQLLNYAMLALSFLGLDDGHEDQTVEIVLTVIQPRNYTAEGPVRTWGIMGSDLRGYRNQLRNALIHASDMLQGIAVRDENRRVTVSDECEYCTARYACPAFQQAAYASMQHVSEPGLIKMSPAALGKELAMLHDSAKILKARTSGLEEHALALIRKGVTVPGYAIDHGRGRTVWREGKQAEVISLAEMLNPAHPLNLRKTAEAVTPKQAVKMGFPEDLATVYAHTPPGKATLERSTEHSISKIFNRGNQ